MYCNQGCWFLNPPVYVWLHLHRLFTLHTEVNRWRYCEPYCRIHTVHTSDSGAWRILIKEADLAWGGGVDTQGAGVDTQGGGGGEWGLGGWLSWSWIEKQETKWIPTGGWDPPLDPPLGSFHTGSKANPRPTAMMWQGVPLWFLAPTTCAIFLQALHRRL